jgi:virginiamycin B lyase
MRSIATVSIAAVLAAAAGNARAQCDPSTCAKDFPINYPNKNAQQGSTHEITFNRNGGTSFWITAPTYDSIAEISAGNKQKFFPMPAHSGPHGIAFDASGQLYVSFERAGEVARVNAKTGAVEKRTPVAADPHGLGIAQDGKTIWFTGKTKNTVGKIQPDGKVANFSLATPDALPIYVAAGPDGNMWFTELTGNKIGRVTPDGQIAEFPIPTPGSRPIAIVQDPSAPAMWFSEEAGNKVARVDMSGAITEFQVPKSQENVILAGLAFDEKETSGFSNMSTRIIPVPPGPTMSSRSANRS